MTDQLRSFFEQQTEDQKKAQQESVDQASSEGRIALKVSGRYLMEVNSFAFKDNETGKMRQSPELRVSDKKKSLMIAVNLKVVDGTPAVPRGASIFNNVVLSPASGASRDKIDNTMRLMKPIIVALTGQEKIDITAEWIEEWLVPCFEEQPDKSFKLIKDHKMKNKVMVVIEDDVYQDKETLKVVSITKAQEGDKSISNKPLTDRDDSSQNLADPSKEELKDDDIKADAALIQDESNTSTESTETKKPASSNAIPDTPDVQDF